MDLIEDLSRIPSLEEEPLSDEENELIDHWIATEASSPSASAETRPVEASAW